LKDVAQFAKLVDGLENIHFYLLPLYPTELNKEVVDVNRFYTGLSNTSKHIMGGIYTKKGVSEVIKTAEMIAGSPQKLRERPIISFITCVMSPLKIDSLYGDMLIEIARKGIPVACPSEPLCGATSPVTLAGNLVLVNAESLAGITLAQLVNPGTPVMYGCVATIADMQTMNYLSSGPETALLNAGAAQLAQYCKIPCYVTAGMSDSKIPDAQAGYEKALSTLSVALAGGNYIHDAAGVLEFCTTISYEQAVIDNEIIGMVLRILEGIKVTKDTLAEDIIDKVGPGGHFMTEGHTIKHMRSEFFYPKVSDRLKREQWVKEGNKDSRIRAKEIAIDILKSHKPLPISSEVDERIKKFFAKKLRRVSYYENTSNHLT